MSYKYEFSTERDLMTHKQKVRTEKVSICWQFATGSCDFGEEYCWFIHCQLRQNLETVNFNCNSCDKEFRSWPDFLKHRKQEHTHLVPPYRNEKNGLCRFGDLKCWFKHSKFQKTNKSKDIEKLVKVNEDDIEKLKGVDDKFKKQNEGNKTKFK